MKRLFLLPEGCHFNIVLFQPDIPQNTGNIGRLCVATRSTLHLIKPFGFRLSDKKLRRAGLDYWDKLRLLVYSSWEEFLDKNSTERMFFFSTRGERLYFSAFFSNGDYFVFGSETDGLPEYMLLEYWEKVLNIPMSSEVRSLNLADSVSVVLYEAIRQVFFSI